MLELRLIHDGIHWIAENESMRAMGNSLHALDENIAFMIRQDNPFNCPSRITVRMHFDQSVYPAWIRQYANHYFNRIVTINLHEQ